MAICENWRSLAALATWLSWQSGTPANLALSKNIKNIRSTAEVLNPANPASRKVSLDEQQGSIYNIPECQNMFVNGSECLVCVGSGVGGCWGVSLGEWETLLFLWGRVSTVHTFLCGVLLCFGCRLWVLGAPGGGGTVHVHWSFSGSTNEQIEIIVFHKRTKQYGL